MESNGDIIKFYCFNVILNMAMNIHVTVRFLQLKKKNLIKKRSSFETTSKMMLPISLHCFNNYLCIFVTYF